MFVHQLGCQTFQAKSLPCPKPELISYPLERNVHDALPSPPLNGENTLLTNSSLTLSVFLQIKPVGALVLILLVISWRPLLHGSRGKSLWIQWSVCLSGPAWAAQTALSTGCPFFLLARPITQPQHKHSFLWSTEPLWKRPFNWTLSSLPPPPFLPPSSPSPSKGGPSLRSPVTNKTGSMLRQSKPSLKAF